MDRAHIIRFAIAVGLQIVFFAALNFFDDWTLQGMPDNFVAAAFLSGVCYLAAVSSFPICASRASLAAFSATAFLVSAQAVRTASTACAERMSRWWLRSFPT